MSVGDSIQVLAVGRDAYLNMTGDTVPPWMVSPAGIVRLGADGWVVGVAPRHGVLEARSARVEVEVSVAATLEVTPELRSRR